MHQTQFSQKIPYGGFSQIRSHIVIIFMINADSSDEFEDTKSDDDPSGVLIHVPVQSEKPNPLPFPILSPQWYERQHTLAKKILPDKELEIPVSLAHKKILHL